jgi:dihydrofolate reductase
MARLIYLATVSLDGCVEDRDGRFDWSAPDEEVHQFIDDLVRPVGTFLFGRRMYETMAVWDTPEAFPDPSLAIRDFAEVWRAADKVVYSRTLDATTTARTRLEREFDPASIRRMKADAGHDLSVGGAELAAHAFAAGLVDEIHLFVVPAVIGGGKHALPDGVRLDLELLDEHRFGNGTVYLRYRVGT